MHAVPSLLESVFYRITDRAAQQAAGTPAKRHILRKVDLIRPKGTAAGSQYDTLLAALLHHAFPHTGLLHDVAVPTGK